MARLGLRISDVPFSIGWDGLVLFVEGLGEDSAYFRARNQEYAPWTSKLKQMQVLTDIYDLISATRYNMITLMHAKTQQPLPYQRPWADDGKQHIGSGGIPISEFNEWYYEEV
ncbi:MAG: hypothetical protein IKE43_09490 [Coriobacteriales bacterium]|nr:hypothetical protein [Coriobacteriales bacterium]